MSDDEDYRIRQRAYDLWAEAGRPDGRHLEFWIAAEQEAHVGEVKSKEAEPAPEAGSLDQSLAGERSPRRDEPWRAAIQVTQGLRRSAGDEIGPLALRVGRRINRSGPNG